MICRILIFLLVGFGYGLAQPAIPDTVAGHTLRAWMDTFNSGDRAKIEAYVKTVDPSRSVDGMITFHEQTGGFDLPSIESSGPRHIRFWVQEKGGPTTGRGNIVVQDGPAPMVEGLGLRGLPAGVRPANGTPDA